MRGFWALRRRSDKVKAALLLFLLAGWMGLRSAGTVWEWWQAARVPAEYVVAPGASGAVLSARLDALFARDDVAGVTPQWEEGVRGSTLQAPAYRVLCRGADLSGVTRHAVEDLGFALVDPGALELQEARSRLLGVRLGYGFLASGLAWLAGWALFRWEKACAALP